MTLIKHRLSHHKINLQTEILIIGTFNPETPQNTADFFYGRQRNFLWTLISTAFGDNSLKGKTKEEKLNYIKDKKIDFIDLIAEVNVDEPDNYKDNYLDKKVVKWREVINEIQKLKNLKKVCFTRKSFSDIPNMTNRIKEIKEFCNYNNIIFQYLTTPARFYNAAKQQEWTTFLLNDNQTQPGRYVLLRLIIPFNVYVSKHH